MQRNQVGKRSRWAVFCSMECEDQRVLRAAQNLSYMQVDVKHGETTVRPRILGIKLVTIIGESTSEDLKPKP